MDNVPVEYPVNTAEDLSLFVSDQKENGWEALTDQKKAFCHAYTMEYNHRESAVEVGFAANSGIRLLRDPLVAAYLAHLQDLQLTSNIITKEYINTNYMKLLEIATGQVEMPIMLATGEQVYGKKVMVGEATNILKEMSKSIEYAKDTGTKSAAVSVSINFGSLLGDSGPPVVIDQNVIDTDG
ncbi:MAG: hypothetical protein DRQ39_10555 [Gammaproteobacteria bacterium]|nr:MAG: hypothetical protein DRQ39_10555 [Gammaproteobacteria bacterium]